MNSTPPRPGKSRDERLLTAAEVGARLAISRRSVQRLALTGRIPAVYLGPRTLRFEREKVERWIRESYRRPRPRRRRKSASRKSQPSCPAPGTRLQSPPDSVRT